MIIDRSVAGSIHGPLLNPLPAMTASIRQQPVALRLAWKAVGSHVLTTMHDAALLVRELPFRLA